jgi:uncharacterized protein YjbI with pentapeptide repeats
VQLDPNTTRAVLPAALGILAAILSGCLGGVLGYAVPLHKDWLRRRLERRKGVRDLMGVLLFRGRLYARQGMDMVELRPEAYLRAADLMGRNLEAVDLRGTNLEGANLQGAILQRCNLANARLSGANLWGANLLGCDLRRANLRYAMLREADLAGASLLGTDLTGADLSGANLRGANLEGADLSGANVSRADLKWAKLDGRTAMPEGWKEMVACRPAPRSVAPRGAPAANERPFSLKERSRPQIIT